MKRIKLPSTKGEQKGDGRDVNTGRFQKGWKGGPGNPAAARVFEYRSRMFQEIKRGDITLAIETIRNVMKSGKDGDRLTAARLLLDRALGMPIALDVEQRIETLEQLISEDK
jgi:hypothetical protein